MTNVIIFNIKILNIFKLQMKNQKVLPNFSSCLKNLHSFFNPFNSSKLIDNIIY